MPGFEVAPGAVQNTGAGLARTGAQMDTVIAAVNGAGGASGAIGDAATAGAYEEMCQIWGVALEQMGRQLDDIGFLTEAAAEMYQATDQAQMLTSGGATS